MDKYSMPLEEGKFYHIYNQGNNKENIFYSLENYEYFLYKFDGYLSDLVEVYAYCLMPNHFHFLIRIKELRELESGSSISKPAKSSRLGRFEAANNKELREISFVNLPSQLFGIEGLEDATIDIPKIVSNQFRLFFMSYSKSINKQLGRTGSLFRKNFKRKEITDFFTRHSIS